METELFKWSDSFSCNSLAIDEQHKVLVSLINKLFSAMKVGKSRDVMKDILTELIKYTSYHFNTEEAYYLHIENEFVKQHLLEHRNFIEEITNFKKRFYNGESEVSIELLKFLRTWITNHILGFDKKSSVYFT